MEKNSDSNGFRSTNSIITRPDIQRLIVLCRSCALTSMTQTKPQFTRTPSTTQTDIWDTLTNLPLRQWITKHRVCWLFIIRNVGAWTQTAWQVKGVGGGKTAQNCESEWPMSCVLIRGVEPQSGGPARAFDRGLSCNSKNKLKPWAEINGRFKPHAHEAHTIWERQRKENQTVRSRVIATQHSDQQGAN